MILAACHPSGVCALEVACIFFENLLTPGLRTCIYAFQRFLTVVVRCNRAAVSAVKEVRTMRSGKTGCFADLSDVHLTHCGPVTQICVFTLQLCEKHDSNLRF